MNDKQESPIRLIKLDRQLTVRVRDKARRERVGDGYRDSAEFAMRFYLKRRLKRKLPGNGQPA